MLDNSLQHSQRQSGHNQPLVILLLFFFYFHTFSFAVAFNFPTSAIFAQKRSTRTMALAPAEMFGGRHSPDRGFARFSLQNAGRIIREELSGRLYL